MNDGKVSSFKLIESGNLELDPLPPEERVLNFPSSGLIL